MYLSRRPYRLLQEGGDKEEEEAASPTIPAIRHSQFDPRSDATPSPVPSLLGLVPRLGLPGKASPSVGPAGTAAAAATEKEAAAAAAAAVAGEGPPSSARPKGIPRLNLTGSMHSNLETRTASAELQVGAVLPPCLPAGLLSELPLSTASCGWPAEGQRAAGAEERKRKGKAERPPAP